MKPGLRSIRSRELIDRNLAPLRELNLSTPANGWIRAVRSALGMSQSQMAKRMGVNQKTIHAMEVSEVSRRIQLETLSRAAETLGCDVFYALVPRRPLGKIVKERASELAEKQLAAVDQTMLLEDQSAGDSHAKIERLAQQILEQGVPLWQNTNAN